MSDKTYQIVGTDIIKKYKDMGDKTYAQVIAPIVLEAGENHFGEFGGNGITVSGEIIRPANTTIYDTNDVLGINVAVVGITAQPVTGLCLIEVAASVIDTILLTGDAITIASVGGTVEANNTAAVPVHVITKVDATHFSIPIPFTNAWTSGGTIAKMFQMDIARINGGSGYINSLRLIMNTTVTLNGMFDIYFYSTMIPAILDHAQQTLLYAHAACGIKLGTFAVLGGGSGSDSVSAELPNINMLFKCAINSKKGFFRLVNTATTGFVPTSGMKLTIVANIDRN